MNNSIKISVPAASKHDRFMKARRKNGFTNTLDFFIIVVGVIFALSVFFRVSKIEVVGNEHYTSDEIIRAIDIEQGDNLFFFDRFAAISRVFAKLPYIEQVSVERSLPGNVVITVSECKAMAYIVIGEEEWTIDHNCKVLGKAAADETSGLLPITGFNPGTLLIGETLSEYSGNDDAVEYLREVLSQISGRGLTSVIRSVDFTNLKAVKITYGSRFLVNLGAHHNTEHKFGMLLSAISQLKDGDVGTINVADDTTAYFYET